MKRLGFDEKRRLGTGAQYRITPKKVKLTLILLGIKGDLPTETKQTTETSQTAEKTPDATIGSEPVKPVEPAT